MTGRYGRIAGLAACGLLLVACSAQPVRKAPPVAVDQARQTQLDREAALDQGNAIITLSEEEVAKFREAARPVIERWIGEMREISIDGEALLDAAETAIERHSG